MCLLYVFCDFSMSAPDFLFLRSVSRLSTVRQILDRHIPCLWLNQWALLSFRAYQWVNDVAYSGLLKFPIEHWIWVLAAGEGGHCRWDCLNTPQLGLAYDLTSLRGRDAAQSLAHVGIVYHQRGALGLPLVSLDVDHAVLETYLWLWLELGNRLRCPVSWLVERPDLSRWVLGSNGRGNKFSAASEASGLIWVPRLHVVSAIFESCICSASRWSRSPGWRHIHWISFAWRNQCSKFDIWAWGFIQKDLLGISWVVRTEDNCLRLR